MNFEPRPGQSPIVDYVAEHERCNVFGPVGVGKTSAVVWVLNAFRLIDTGPSLVIAPPRVARSTWPEEVSKYDNVDLQILPLHGTPRARAQQLAGLANFELATISYNLLPWLVAHYGAAWPFSTVIADESCHLQSFRGRMGGLQAQAVGKVAHTLVKRWVNLDGTPGLSGVGSLWGPQWFVDKGARLGTSYTKFKERFFTIKYRGPNFTKWEPRPEALAEITELLADCSVSVEPPTTDQPIFNPVYVDLPAHARAAYTAMEKAFFVELAKGETIEAFDAGGKSGKLLQIANGAAYLDRDEADPDSSRPWQDLHDQKLVALDSILNETHEPVIVAYHYRPDLYRLQRRYPHGVWLGHNPSTIRDWNAGKIPLLFVHALSCGEGTNLQDGGRTMVFYSRTWGARPRVQLIERIGPTRQLQSGHPRAVFVHDIVARNTIDEDVLASYTSGLTVMETLLQRMQRNA